ncbi:MAG: PstS family phosphate ABC transporter substrate-binding protein, partial [Planctomycetota bacterium]
IGYKTSGVRAIPLAKKGNSYKEAVIENVLDGSYPLARFLYIYVNKKPGKPLDPLILEFVKYILSKEGQEVVIKDGYIPLPASVIKEELGKIK